MSVHVDILAQLDDRALAASARRLEAELTRAGHVSGAAFSRALEQEVARTNLAASAITSKLSNQMSTHGRTAARGFGSAFGSELAGAIPGISSFQSALSGYEGAAAKIGGATGRALGLAFTAAAAGAVAAAAFTIFKGFQRYEVIDAAKFRLQALNKTLEATGKQGIDIKKVMQDVNDVVLGTPYALDQAFSVAVTGMGSGVRDIKGYMQDVADAAAWTGESILDIGRVFTQIINQGKVDSGMLNNQLQNLPIRAWLMEAYNVTGQVMQKMIETGQIGIDQVRYVIQKNAHGLAQQVGQTLQGSISNMLTAIARLGEKFIGAIFGGPAETQVNTLTQAVQRFTTRIDEVGKWVTAHRDDIRQVFTNVADAVRNVGSVLGWVLTQLGKHREAVYLIIGAWATFKGLQIATTFTEIALAAKGATTATAGMGAASAAGLGSGGLLGALGAVAGPLALVVADLLLMKKIMDDIRGAKIELGSIPDLPKNATPQQQQFQQENVAGGLYNVPASLGGMGPEPPPGTEYKPGWVWSATQGKYIPRPGAANAPGVGIGAGAPAAGTWRPPTPMDQPGDWAGPGAPPPLQPSREGAGPGGKKGPTAPEVPYPSEYTTQPLPGEKPEDWEARLSRVRASIEVQEAQQRLDQLIALNTDQDQENNVDEEQVIAARKRLTDAKIAQTQNEQRLNDATQKTLEKPQVPYPAGMGALPTPGQTAEQYSQTQSYLSAVHDRQVAEAALTQLQNTGKYTQDQLTEAQNNLTKARSDEYQALLRLNDSTSKASSNLEDVGVKLDQDFGISRGLPGIAENIVRFLANLAFAPALGALTGIREGLGGTKEGGGLLGIGAALSGITSGTGTGTGTKPGQASNAFPGGYPPPYGSQFPIQYPGGGNTPYPSGNLYQQPSTTAGYMGTPGDVRLAAGTQPYGLTAEQAAAGDFPPEIMQLAAAFNLKPSTYAGHQATATTATSQLGVPIAPNPKGLNRGIDWTGSPEDMNRFADFLIQSGFPGLEQVIHRDPKTGKNYGYPGGVNYPFGEETGMVHTRFSQIPSANPGTKPGNMMALFSPRGGPGGSTLKGMPGGPMSPDQMRSAIIMRGRQLGLSDTEIRMALAVGQHESNWNPVGFMGFGPEAKAGGYNFDTNSMGAIDQFYRQYTSRMPPGLNRDDPAALSNYIWRTVHNAADPQYGPKLLNAFNQTQLPAFASGGPVPIIAHSGEHVLSVRDVKAMGGQSGVYAFRNALHMEGGGTVGGPYRPEPQPIAYAPSGPLPGPSPIGGAEQPVGMGGGSGAGGQGFGNTGLGGAAASAGIGAGAAALDAMAPGAGTAAAIAVNIAIQEITRAIGFGAQAAGIGVQGLMETFLPTGASELAMDNWLTRIAGGFIGARPQLPTGIGGPGGQQDITTMAGQGETFGGQLPAVMQPPVPTTPTPEQVVAQKEAPGGGGVAARDQQPGPTFNVTYNNNNAPQNVAENDLNAHTAAMWENMQLRGGR